MEDRKMSDPRNSRVRARFDPKIPYALVPRLAELAGIETDFTFVRKMDEDETYPGEWLLRADDRRLSGYVVPERDLMIIGNSPNHRPGRSPN